MSRADDAVGRVGEGRATFRTGRRNAGKSITAAAALPLCVGGVSRIRARSFYDSTGRRTDGATTHPRILITTIVLSIFNKTPDRVWAFHEQIKKNPRNYIDTLIRHSRWDVIVTSGDRCIYRCNEFPSRKRLTELTKQPLRKKTFIPC